MDVDVASSDHLVVGANGDPAPGLVALDIETSTDGVDGLDPTSSRVVAAALAASDGSSVVFDDADESVLLGRLDALLASRSGMLVTWNGAGFDLPFLAARYRACSLVPSLAVRPDASLPVKYAGPAGLGLPVRARWGALGHVDVAHLYKDLAAELGVAWSLKPLARRLGFQPVEVDRTAIHLLAADELHDYVVSDALVTLALALRLPAGSLAGALVDVP